MQNENFKFYMPEGLKELMSDISREVLRAQPADLLQFITKYLAALLVTRDNIRTAARIRDDACDHIRACAHGWEDELRSKGINGGDIATIREIVDKRFEDMSSGKPTARIRDDACDLIRACAHGWVDELRAKSIDGGDIATIREIFDKRFEDMSSGKPIKEDQLLSLIMHKTSVSPEQAADVVEAIRGAFLRSQTYTHTHYEMSPLSSSDEVAKATQHTLQLYHNTNPTAQDYHDTAEKIQAAYRAYGVKRQTKVEADLSWSYAPDVIKRAQIAVDETNVINTYTKSDTTDNTGKINTTVDGHLDGKGGAEKIHSDHTEDTYTTYNTKTRRSSTISLDGSHEPIPEYYGATHSDNVSMVIETHEEDHKESDYSVEEDIDEEIPIEILMEATENILHKELDSDEGNDVEDVSEFHMNHNSESFDAIPVIEEPFIKKEAYVCGESITDNEKQSDLDESRETDEEPVIPDVDGWREFDEGD